MSTNTTKQTADDLRAAQGGVDNPDIRTVSDPDIRTAIGDPNMRRGITAVGDPEIRAVRGGVVDPEMRRGVVDPNIRGIIAVRMVGDPDLRVAQGGGDGSVRDPDIRGVIAIIAVRTVVNPEIMPPIPVRY